MNETRRIVTAEVSGKGQIVEVVGGKVLNKVEVNVSGKNKRVKVEGGEKISSINVNVTDEKSRATVDNVPIDPAENGDFLYTDPNNNVDYVNSGNLKDVNVNVNVNVDENSTKRADHRSKKPNSLVNPLLKIDNIFENGNKPEWIEKREYHTKLIAVFNRLSNGKITIDQLPGLLHNAILDIKSLTPIQIVNLYNQNNGIYNWKEWSNYQVDDKTADQMLENAYSKLMDELQREEKRIKTRKKMLSLHPF